MKMKNYQHFSPLARALEVLGEKWTLMIVRDLLRGPRRFTDLQRFLYGITPKWLTQRLRDLEAAGIVERDSEKGRREVWYRLTQKGERLEPVVQALVVWGVDYARRPPRPGEPMLVEHTLPDLVAYFNIRGVRLPRPTTWLLRVPGFGAYTIHFDGEKWNEEPGETDADLTIDASAEAWVFFTTVRFHEREQYADQMRFHGEPEYCEEFLEIFRVGGRKPKASTSNVPAKAQ